MRILLQKGIDAPDRLTCHRDDGSIYTTELSLRSVYHDLAHYVVERQLGIQDGFWGILASGHTLEEYALPNAERTFQISPTGYQAEFLATLVQSAVPNGVLSMAYVEMLQTASAASGLPFPDLPESDVLQTLIQETQRLTAIWETASEMELGF